MGYIIVQYEVLHNYKNTHVKHVFLLIKIRFLIEYKYDLSQCFNALDFQTVFYSKNIHNSTCFD